MTFGNTTYFSEYVPHVFLLGLVKKWQIKFQEKRIFHIRTPTNFSIISPANFLVREEYQIKVPGSERGSAVKAYFTFHENW
jgi:hypothetical protein